MIDRKQRRPSLQYSSASSRETSPTPSSVISDCDADDEGAMSAGENFPSRPLSVAIPKGTHYDGPYCPRRPTLADILSNVAPPPWTLSAFMAYLSQNHCLETLEFTMDASRYRKHFNQMSSTAASLPPNEDNVQYVRMLWQRLLEAYITPNGPREVNLPSDVRDTLLNLPNELSPPSPDTLDPAVKIIYELMEESVLVPFLNSYSRRAHPAHSNLSQSFRHSDEHLSVPPQQQSYDERNLRSRRPRRESSPPRPSLDLASSYSSTGSHITHPYASATGRSSASRLSPNASSYSNSNLSGSVSGEMLTDDSASASSPSEQPMTPPSTPPTTDLGGNGGSPKTSWKKMTGKLGWKKKNLSGASSGIASQLRESRSPPPSAPAAALHIEDEGGLL
ncbi:MAG: hypothetical protein M1824_006476 [Vezdaea acicularis]|nr:MAG: hypothetical protein M1824_006476 [Vezdaea acicularis]